MNTHELAKQGDAVAIQVLINASAVLKNQGIVAKVEKNGERLQIILESVSVPDQVLLVKFVHQGLAKIRPDHVNRVRVIGRQSGSDFTAWSEQFYLKSDSPGLEYNPGYQPVKGDDQKTSALKHARALLSWLRTAPKDFWLLVLIVIPFFGTLSYAGCASEYADYRQYANRPDCEDIVGKEFVDKNFNKEKMEKKYDWSLRRYLLDYQSEIDGRCH